jgi:selenide,water dikinase
VETSDDAGVFRLREDLAIVNTVDFFTPVVDDPYTYGLISATNSLSDVYAMGGEPKTALNIACFPQSGLDKEILAEILRGGAAKAAEAGVVVVGGHSVADDEIKYGMAVTGVIDPRKVIRNVGAQVGDVLILTKPLGTGILTTALKREHLGDTEYDAAVASMVMLNRTASNVMQRYPVHACTDITGFSLMGHSCEMAMGSGVTLRLHAAVFPLLPGVLRLALEGYITGGCKRNRTYLADKVHVGSEVLQELNEVAFDPQTSGGLLIAVPASDAEQLAQDLLNEGTLAAAIIGEAIPHQAVWVELLE